jgi:hypothetical protein
MVGEIEEEAGVTPKLFYLACQKTNEADETIALIYTRWGFQDPTRLGGIDCFYKLWVRDGSRSRFG